MQGEGVLEAHLLAFSTKIKPCLDSLGAGARLAVPVSYSHKPPGKFCSVHPLKMHSKDPGSHTTTRMGIPIHHSQVFFSSGALLFKCPFGTGAGLRVPPWPPACRETFAALQWRGWKTLPTAWEAPAPGKAWGWADQQGNPKAPPNPATLLMQKTTPHRPIF